MSKKWAVFLEDFIDKGSYKWVLEGLRNTMLVAVFGLLIGILIGTVIAVIKVFPKYRLLPRILDRIVTVYVAFFRGTPIVVQLLVGYYVLFPLLGMHVSSLSCCITIFGLNSGAYVSEIMRGGINSVDPGQLEAARALGLGFPISMLKVVVPQAIKNILPTLGNEFITLIKETSVVSFVGARDLKVAFDKIYNSTYEIMVPYLMMALIYIVLVLIISSLIKLMERKLAKSDRSSK